MADKEKIKTAVRMLLEAINEDPDREGLIETPERVARMYEEIFSGMQEDPKEVLSKTFSIESNDLVIEKDIPFYSMCEHHMLPFFGQALIAYIPNGKVAGLSKLGRVVDTFAKRLQLQEQLTAQIADVLMMHLDARGVMVILEGEHLCMSMRGVKKPGSKTITTATRGIFKENSELVDAVMKLKN